MQTGFTLAKEMTTPEAIAQALDMAASQINSCAVALTKLGLGGLAAEAGTDSHKLLSAFCDAVDVRDSLRATEKQAA